MGNPWLNAALLPLFLASACGPTASIYRDGYALTDASPDVLVYGSGGSNGHPGAGGQAAAGASGKNGGVTGSASGGRTGAGGTTGSGGAGGISNAGTGGTPSSGSGGNSTAEPQPPGTGGSGVPDAGLEALGEPAATFETEVGGAVANTNLTTLGKLDWVHWGQGRNVSAINRKRNVTPIVSTFTKLGSRPLGTYNDRPSAHSWSDGSPSQSITNSKDGMVTGDAVGGGFELRITSSSQSVRRVRVYVGVWEATAKMTAQLENSGLPAYTDTSLVAQGATGADRTYTFTFRPKKDTDVLVIRWTVEQLTNMYGNVTLQAAAVWE
jgi:hypothetical protein